MALREAYRRQVALLVQTLPFVGEEECFALKGGTAINLFHRNLPRLSVDIDLTYLPITDRQASLEAIDNALRRMAQRISDSLPRCKLQLGQPTASQKITKLIVSSFGVQVKLEVTPVLRGCVYEPEVKRVSEQVEETFGFAEVQLVSFPDLYAGKIVAALDRQHPRDLFDVRDLLANEGIDEALRRAFVIYTLSHNRPMAEVLAPSRKDISQEFERGFLGMTDVPVSLKDLTDAREEIIEAMVGRMPSAHRDMLLSFEAGEPDWSMLGISHAATLPAVRWRLQNLGKLEPERRKQLFDNLEAALRPR